MAETGAAAPEVKPANRPSSLFPLPPPISDPNHHRSFTMRPGIYERLVREGEEAELQQLEAAGRAWVDGVSESERRDLLLDDLASRIPELLDRAASSSGDEVTRLRAETTMTVGWIAERLAMGTQGYLNHLLYRQRKLGGE